MRKLPKPAGGIISYFTRHRTAANLLLVVLMILGLTSLPKMRAQFFPDVIIDNVTVSVLWDGAGAEDVDRAIVQLLEPALLAVDGVEESTANSREGRASITLEFEPGTDMGRAAEDVQSAVDVITTLPEEAEEPVIRRGAWADTVTDVVISGPVAPEQLGRYADEMIIRLFDRGITRTTIVGVAAPETLIEVPMAALIANDVTMAEIAEAIAGEVTADPAGDVTGANARVRTGVEKRAPDQIEAVVLRRNADGSTLRVGDVARVALLGSDRDRSFFVGGDPAVTIRINRSDAGDAIEMQRDVQDLAAEMEATLPQSVTIELIRTRAEMISARLSILLDSAKIGLALVLGLLFLFLNARTALWVAAGIPVALLSAMALMYFAGLTINMISLFALIITLGIVVDDAIVVGEHADARARRGEPPVEAAENAARRMTLPVFSSTMTTVIAFFGLVIIGGRFGDLIKDIPFTVIVVLMASLVECFLILPNHMAHALTSAGREHWYDWPSRQVNRGFDWIRLHLFRPLIAMAVRGRYAVLAGAVMLLAGQVAMVIDGRVQWRFFNPPESGSVSGSFAMLEGATRDDSLAMMRELQRATEELGTEYADRYGRNPLDFVIAELGGSSGRGLAGADTKDADLLGGISIELIDADLRPEYSSFAFVGELQERVAMYPLVETLSFRGHRAGPGGDSLDVQFYGASATDLKAAAEALKTEMAKYPEASGVEDNLAYDKVEMVLELTPQGQALGFTIDSLGRVLRHRLNGIEAATYPDGPRSATVQVELPASELSADFLERMQMRTGAGTYVPLADLVRVTQEAGFSTVRRENGLRVVSVTGDISQDNAARYTEILQALKQDILPRIASEKQVEFRIAGLSEQENEFLNDARNGLILTLVGIYLVLAFVFASWTRPIVVMAIIPFGLVGAIWGHYVWGVPLSMFTVVGLLGMVGIIINDSIVLVTSIDDFAEERGLRPSIIDGAADRLRPVLLTTLTTVLGLAPLLYETSSQAQFLKPTVITLCYGLGFGMALVLLLVPALVAMQSDFARATKAFRHAIRARRARGLRGLMLAGTALMLGWLTLTMGWSAIAGTMPGPLAALGAGMGAAFAAFFAGLAVLVLALFVLGMTVRLDPLRRA